MMEFLSMGGYAAYIWPAYVIVAVVLVLNVYLPLRRHRRLLDDLSHRGARSRKSTP